MDGLKTKRKVLRGMTGKSGQMWGLVGVERVDCWRMPERFTVWIGSFSDSGKTFAKLLDWGWRRNDRWWIFSPRN